MSNEELNPAAATDVIIGVISQFLVDGQQIGKIALGPTDYRAGSRPVYIPVAGPHVGDPMESLLPDGRVLTVTGFFGDWRLSISENATTTGRQAVWVYGSDVIALLDDLLIWDGNGEPPHAKYRHGSRDTE